MEKNFPDKNIDYRELLRFYIFSTFFLMRKMYSTVIRIES